MKNHLLIVVLTILAALGPGTAQRTATAQQPVPGTDWVETTDFGRLPAEILFPGDNSHMILVPAGTYTIGLEDPVSMGLQSREGPQVQVTLGSYYIDKYEVSVARYVQWAEATGATRPRYSDQREYVDDHPVSAVSQADALEFARSMRRDLPTEAEWEVAARGPEAFMYPWGNDPDPDAAVLGRGVAARPAPVGSTPRDRSPWGVMDMGGNVAEWTKDPYARDYYQQVAGNPGQPIRSADSNVVTYRGGDYINTVDGRATRREPGVAGHFREEVGFRTVFRLQKAPPPTPAPTPVRVLRDPEDDQRSEEQLVADLLPAITAMLAGGAAEVPEGLAAGTGSVAAQAVWNQSPVPVRFATVNLETRTVFDSGTEVPAGRVGNIRLPSDPGQIAHVFAYAPAGTRELAVALDPVTRQANPLIVLEPGNFVEFVDPSGGVRPFSDRHRSRQVFGKSLVPQWNQFTVINETGAVVELTLTLKHPQTGELRDETTRILEPGQAARVEDFVFGRVEGEARYIPSDGTKSSRDFAFVNDDGADGRIIRLVGDEASPDTVRVLTRRLPMIIMILDEYDLAGDVRATYRK